VVEEEPIRPSLIPRSSRGQEASSAQSAIDKDLETICLKCLEKPPHRRYASADALADDLERWFTGEPILARPANGLQRAVKWVRRKPSIAALSTVVVLVAALGLAGVLWKTPDPNKHPNNPAPTGPAALMVPPEDTTAAAGATATFGIVPVGEEPLSFHWKKDGAHLTDSGRIRGATTATLSITDVQAGDLGSYSVVVSNAYASVTSETAELLFSPPRFDWVQSMWGRGPGVVSCYAVAVDSRGNVYVTGAFWDTAEFGSASVTSRGEADIWIAKYSSQRTLIWVRSAGGLSKDNALGVAVDRAGNVYISGYFNGTATFAHTDLTSAGKKDGFIAKYSPSGELLWVGQSDLLEENKKRSIGVDDLGGCFVTGRFEGTAGFGSTNLTSTGKEDFFLARYETDGTAAWAVQGGGAQDDGGISLALDPAGNCYVTGSIEATTKFSDVVLTGKKHYRYLMVAKYSKSGTLLWLRQGEPIQIRHSGEGITVDRNGNVYVVGIAGYGENPKRTLSVTKFNTSGSRQWQQEVLGSFAGGNYHIASDEAGNCSVMCALKGTATFGNTTVTSTAPGDVYIANFNPLGSLRWIQKTEGAGRAVAGWIQSIAMGPAGEIYVCGDLSGTEQFGPHRLTSRGKTDTFVAKLINWSPTASARSNP